MALLEYMKKYPPFLPLKDGSSILLRPLLPGDAVMLIHLFDSLSERTKYLRFLRHMDTLPEKMLYSFTHIDYVNEYALAATLQEGDRGAIVAVARYARGTDGEPADLAMAVRDDWQNRGLGKGMLKRLIDIGNENGIDRFVSMMDPANAAMKHILTALGYRAEYSASNGVYIVNIDTRQGG